MAEGAGVVRLISEDAKASLLGLENSQAITCEVIECLRPDEAAGWDALTHQLQHSTSDESSPPSQRSGEAKLDDAEPVATKSIAQDHSGPKRRPVLDEDLLQLLQAPTSFRVVDIASLYPGQVCSHDDLAAVPSIMPMTGEISLKDIQMLISINSPILRDSSMMDFYRDAQTMDDGDFSDRLARAVGRSAEFRSYCNARTNLHNRKIPVLLTKTLSNGCWAFLFLHANDYSSGRCVVAAANDWHFRWSLMHEAMAARFGQPPPGAGNAPGKAPAATSPPPPRTVPATGAAAPSDDWVYIDSKPDSEGEGKQRPFIPGFLRRDLPPVREEGATLADVAAPPADVAGDVVGPHTEPKPAAVKKGLEQIVPEEASAVQTIEAPRDASDISSAWEMLTFNETRKYELLARQMSQRKQGDDGSSDDCLPEDKFRDCLPRNRCGKLPSVSSKADSPNKSSPAASSQGAAEDSAQAGSKEPEEASGGAAPSPQITAKSAATSVSERAWEASKAASSAAEDFVTMQIKLTPDSTAAIGVVVRKHTAESSAPSEAAAAKPGFSLATEPDQASPAPRKDRQIARLREAVDGWFGTYKAPPKQDYDDSCDDSEDDYEPMRYNPPSRRRNRTSTAHPRVTSLPVASSRGAAEEAAPARSKSKEASAAAFFIAASAASKSAVAASEAASITAASAASQTAEKASEADSSKADSLELTSDESVSGAETRVPHSPASSDSCRYSQFMYLDVCDCSSCEEYRRERWNSRRAQGWGAMSNYSSQYSYGGYSDDCRS